MKKLLSFLLVTATLLSVFSSFAFSASADFPSSDEMNGYENLCLTYNFNIKVENNGRHLVEDLAPYVAYYDTNGNIKDFFFDSFLFLPVNGYAPSGGTLHYDPGKPNKASDWEAYVDDTFYENANVNALNTAMGEAKKALNDNQTKAGVILTIMYPGWGDSNFGTLNGKALDFKNVEDRKYAIKWMIDEQMSRFEEADYEHLELIGFYWLEEWIISYGNREENLSLYRYAGEYLESLGLKYLWIPYYQSTGYKEWQSFGFDIACMQPNMYFGDKRDPQQVVDSIAESKKYGMGMEVEIDYNAITSDEYYQRYLDYLEAGMNGGAMDSIKMYYQGGKPAIYYHAYKATSTRARSIYDLTYKYAKGTLTQADINANRPFKLPAGVEIVSDGKSYVTSGAYVGDGSSEYQKVDGKELTDGVIGTSELGTEWHPFHVSLVDKDKRMSVTVDLGEEYKNLTHFGAHFSHIQNHGIGDPSDVRIYISTDGTNFTEIAKPQIQVSGIAAFVEYQCNAVTARYVKFSFLKSNFNFVFASEVYVGASDENTPVDPPVNPPVNPPVDPEVKLGDVNDDGAIDQYDYILVKRHYFETRILNEEEMTRADVNKDSVVDQFDYILIARHYFGTYVIG